MALMASESARLRAAVVVAQARSQWRLVRWGSGCHPLVRRVVRMRWLVAAVIVVLVSGCGSGPSVVGSVEDAASPSTTTATPATSTTASAKATVPPGGGSLRLASGWEILVPANWTIVTIDPVGMAEFSAEQFEGDFGVSLQAAVAGWGESLEGAAFGPASASLFAVAAPAYPSRSDLDLAEATLRRGFAASPLEVLDLRAEAAEIGGADYGILGYVRYRDPSVGDDLEIVSLTLGTGLGDAHLTLGVTVESSMEDEALGMVESVVRRD